MNADPDEYIRVLTRLPGGEVDQEDDDHIDASRRLDEMIGERSGRQAAEEQRSRVSADAENTIGMLVAQQRRIATQLRELRAQSMSTEFLPMPVMVGGGDEDNKEFSDRYDIRIYKLLALADTFHDFSSSKKTKSRERMDRDLIHDALGTKLPFRECPPKEDPKAFLASEDGVINFFNDNETLSFGGDTVCHPLHGRNMMSKFNVSSSMHNTHDYWKSYRDQYTDQYIRHLKSPESLSVDVWSLPQFEEKQGKVRSYHGERPNYKAVVYLSQIANIVASIKHLFGTGRLTFIVDKSDCQISRMIMATSKLDVAIGRLFIVKAGETDDGISEERLAADQDPRPRSDWSFKICDANLLDATVHIRPQYDPESPDDAEFPEPEDHSYYLPNPDFSRARTGDVFRADDDIQITLNGITGGDDDDPIVSYNINGSERTCRHEDQEFSKGWVRKEIREMMRDGDVDLEFVRNRLARKRSCDWGQVAHCRNNDSIGDKFIFVSTDKLACLYGLYRNVNVMFLRQEATGHNDTWIDTPKIMQNTFTMIRSLTVEEEDAKNKTDAVGGGKGVLLPMLLLGITVAASIFGR